ncbi:MAG: hypothetical protein K2G79_06210 [Muribaculum sp.]|nr:hypothetical protein [Muribaculum sp.]
MATTPHTDINPAGCACAKGAIQYPESRNRILPTSVVCSPIDAATITWAELDMRYRTLLSTYGDGTYPPAAERDCLTAIFAILRQRSAATTDPAEAAHCCATMLDILSRAFLLRPDLTRYPYLGARAHIDRLQRALRHI